MNTTALMYTIAYYWWQNVESAELVTFQYQQYRKQCERLHYQWLCSSHVHPCPDHQGQHVPGSITIVNMQFQKLRELITYHYSASNYAIGSWQWHQAIFDINMSNTRFISNNVSKISNMANFIKRTTMFSTSWIEMRSSWHTTCLKKER